MSISVLDPSLFLLSQVTSNLGKMILKEEMEKSLPTRRKARSLPDRTPFHTCECHAGSWGLPGQTLRPESNSQVSVVCPALCYCGYKGQKIGLLAQGAHAVLRARIPVLEQD